MTNKKSFKLPKHLIDNISFRFKEICKLANETATNKQELIDDISYYIDNHRQSENDFFTNDALEHFNIDINQISSFIKEEDDSINLDTLDKTNIYNLFYQRELKKLFYKKYQKKD